MEAGARPIVLNAFTMAAVSHLNYGLWRHPEDETHRYTSLDYWTGLARSLEAAGFDCLFIADALGLIDVYGGDARASLRHGIQSPLIDPTLIVSAMAAATTRLGFGVTASTTYEHPYATARRFSTLDHLTDGRIGWNVVTSQQDSAARNLGLDRQVPHDERYDRADEFMDVVYKLWQGSWDDDAVVRDRARGVYTDPDRVHAVGHAGRHYRVPDAHVCAPSRQRVPVLFQAGSSGRGLLFAASHAEMVFVTGADARGVRENVARTRELAAAAGRDPASLRFVTSTVVVVGEDDRDARRKFADYRRYYDPIGSVVHYASMTGVDYAATAGDAVLRYRDTEASRSTLAQFDPAVSGRSWTLDEAVNPPDGFGRARTLVGGPATVADAIEDWLRQSDTDGINLAQLVHPASWHDFGALVIPELRRRGRVGAADADSGTGGARTLRERLFPDAATARPFGGHPAMRHVR